VRSGLVIGEIALALVLLVGAGLLVRSFVRMRQVDLGYDPRGLMTISLTLPRVNKDKLPFGREVLEKLSQVPGIQSASLMSFATFGGLNMAFNLESKPFASGDQNASYSSVTPEYFQTLKVPLRAGREFNDFDKAETEPVAIINETLAREYFSGEDPIGQKLILVYLGQRQTREIVGVAADVRQDEPKMPTRPEIFVPFAQQPWFAAWAVIRTSVTNPLSLRESLQQALWSVDRSRLPAKFASTEETLAEFVAAPRLYTLLLGVFAGVALLLASIGIYGVISYSVVVRTREIGIRMALGANRANVLKMIMREGVLLAVAGLSIGLAAALVLTRLLEGLLYGVSATDPATFAGISALLMGIALLACAIPARRATKVDPMVALRDE
jgi:putative ABC transport system permease protein